MQISFSTRSMVDFMNNKRYSETVRSGTVCLLFSILAETDYECQSANIRTIFLYGKVPDT